jgi:hypothetical protein
MEERALAQPEDDPGGTPLAQTDQVRLVLRLPDADLAELTLEPIPAQGLVRLKRLAVRATD